MTDAISSSKKLSFIVLLNDGGLSKTHHDVGQLSNSTVIAHVIVKKVDLVTPHDRFDPRIVKLTVVLTD
jgi:hypothetical protein